MVEYPKRGTVLIRKGCFTQKGAQCLLERGANYKEYGIKLCALLLYSLFECDIVCNNHHDINIKEWYSL